MSFFDLKKSWDTHIKKILFYTLLGLGLFFFDPITKEGFKDCIEKNRFLVYNIFYRSMLDSTCEQVDTIFRMAQDGLLELDADLCYSECHCISYYLNKDAYWPSYGFPLIVTGDIIESNCSFCPVFDYILEMKEEN